MILGLLLGLFQTTHAAFDKITIIFQGGSNRQIVEGNFLGITTETFIANELSGLANNSALENQFVQSIDDSLLVLFGEMIPTDTNAAIFGSKAVTASFDRLLERGGMLYFNYSSWTNLSKLPKVKRDYFNKIGAFYRNADIIKGIDGNRFGIMNPGLPHYLTKAPNELSAENWKWPQQVTLQGYQINKLPEGAAPIMVAIDSKRQIYNDIALAVLQENILGNGMILFDGMYGSLRVISRFMENIVVNLYGVPVTSDGSEYFIWQESPWKTSYSNSLPVAQAAELESIQVKVCQNQKTCTKIMLTNQSESPLTFRIEPFEVKGNSGSYSFKCLFTLKEVIPRLNSHKQRQLDPLTRLNEGNIVTIPANETRAVWVDVKGQLPPGKYRSKIAFVPVDNSVLLKNVNFDIEIVDFEFPDVLPVDTYLWGPYSKTWADGKDEAYCGVASEYHLKYLYLGFPKSAIEQGANGPVIRKEQQYYLTDKMRAASKNGKLIYGYGLFSEFDERLRARGFRGEVFDENWIQLFEEWISTWFAHLTDFGLSFDDYIIQLHDEPFPHEIEDLHRCALLLKQIAPDVKIMIDPQSRVSVEDIKILGSVIDLWVPHESLIRTSSESAEYLNFLLETGKPFAPYLCATSNDVQPLLDYYRFRGIRSWLLGASGMFMWAFNSWRGNSWDHWDSEQGSTSRDEAIFYHGDHGPIPSVRAEAFREGVEDYYLLSIATEKLDRGDIPREAETLIDPEKLRELMQKNDADEVQKWRDKLISYL